MLGWVRKVYGRMHLNVAPFESTMTAEDIFSFIEETLKLKKRVEVAEKYTVFQTSGRKLPSPQKGQSGASRKLPKRCRQ